MGKSTTFDFASHLLGQDVQAWILDQQASGKSLRQIVEELDKATQGRIRVAIETVRRWALGNDQDHAA